MSLLTKRLLKALGHLKRQIWRSKLSHHQVDPLGIVTKKDDEDTFFLIKY